MEQFDPSGTPSVLPLEFVLIGDPMNPTGGLLERFAGLTLPSLGVTFYGATPANDFPTTIYTLEYDGAADFPQYPIDLPADLNAVAGLAFLHGTYPSLTPAEVSTAIQLPTQGPTETTYHMIPVENLPLLDPLRSIPFIGNPLADLIQPDLTVIVNLGYGNPDYGWSQGPANVPTPFGLFPNVGPITVLGDLVTGTQHGISNAISDVGSSSLSLPSLSDISNAITWDLSNVTALNLAAAVGDLVTANPATSPIDVVNTLTSVASSDLSVLQPTADIALAAGTTLAYDAQLFVDGVEQGNLLGAVGDPIAADVGLATLAGFLEFEVVADAAATTISALAGLLP